MTADFSRWVTDTGNILRKALAPIVVPRCNHDLTDRDNTMLLIIGPDRSERRCEVCGVSWPYSV